jgi:Rha family phage regulatory protein
MPNLSQLPDIDLRQFITIQKDHPITTSLRVAEAFGKRHDDVLKRLRMLDCSAEFTARNFAASEYIDSTGRTLPMHEMTKDGFMFLVMGFTGAKAAAIKESYIAAFNMMEQALKQNTRIAPDMVAISNQEYIELLKTKIALLETKPTETRKRISPEEKQRIRQMRAAGLNSVEIGRQLNRPNESIRTILRKDGLL